MIGALLCWLNRHNWTYSPASTARMCTRCNRKQLQVNLVFDARRFETLAGFQKLAENHARRTYPDEPPMKERDGSEWKWLR